jgi:anti-anti-sigma regulatory factor
MLRIRRTTDRTITVLTVSGRLDAENVGELRRSLDIVSAGEAVVLDLADLILADREAIRFLADREAYGQIVLRNCPPYVRTWMAAEDME